MYMNTLETEDRLVVGADMNGHVRRNIGTHTSVGPSWWLWLWRQKVEEECLLEMAQGLDFICCQYGFQKVKEPLDNILQRTL